MRSSPTSSSDPSSRRTVVVPSRRMAMTTPDCASPDAFHQTRSPTSGLRKGHVSFDHRVPGNAGAGPLYYRTYRRNLHWRPVRPAPGAAGGEELTPALRGGGGGARFGGGGAPGAGPPRGARAGGG